MTPLTLIAWALAASAPDAGAAPLRWQVPHVVQEVDVPERLFAANYPVTVRAVKTTEKPEDLVHFFLDQFAKARLFMAPQKDLPEPMRSSSLTGLDTETLISYTVIFQPNRDNTTTAIMAETYLAQRRAAGPSFAAVFPNAQGLIRSSSENFQVMTYAAEAKPEEVERFYRETLGSAGFKQSEPGVFVRKGEQLTVHTRADGEHRARVTVMQQLGAARE